MLAPCLRVPASVGSPEGVLALLGLVFLGLCRPWSLCRGIRGSSPQASPSGVRASCCRLLDCRQVVSDASQLLKLGPEALRGGVEQCLATRPIPPERPEAIPVLKVLYGFQGSAVRIAEFVAYALQVLNETIGADDISVVVSGLHLLAVTVGVALAGILFPVALFRCNLASHNPLPVQRVEVVGRQRNKFSRTLNHAGGLQAF